MAPAGSCELLFALPFPAHTISFNAIDFQQGSNVYQLRSQPKSILDTTNEASQHTAAVPCLLARRAFSEATETTAITGDKGKRFVAPPELS